MSRKVLSLCVVILLLGALGLGGFVLMRHRQVEAESDQTTGQAKEQSTAGDKTAGGQSVHLSKEELQKAGIRAAVAQPTSGHPKFEVLAAVLPVQDLFDLTTAFRAAQVQLQRAQISEHASRLEYERLRELNADDKNASDKAVQAAEAIFRSDQATLRNEEQTLRLAEATNLQHWGPIVSRWISSDSPALQGVLAGRDLLLQVTLPDGGAPSRSVLVPIGERTTEAHLLSASTRVDPRFQKQSFLYEVPALPELVPGMNLSAFAMLANVSTGFLVPRNAVLHWQGRTWVYVETASTTFTRREVTLDTPVPTGWLVRHELSKGDHIVITGAQQLLSQEFRAQTGSEGDTD